MHVVSVVLLWLSVVIEEDLVENDFYFLLSNYLTAYIFRVHVSVSYKSMLVVLLCLGQAGG